MIILTIRTDKPEAEIGLFDDTHKMSYVVWHAHRSLAETLHSKIRDMLADAGRSLHDVDAIACYAGPGSFTGLRIGLTVANACAYASEIPIVAEQGDETDNWRDRAIKRLINGETDKVALPFYGADVHITQPRQARAT